MGGLKKPQQKASVMFGPIPVNPPRITDPRIPKYRTKHAIGIDVSLLNCLVFDVTATCFYLFQYQIFITERQNGAYETK